MLMLSRQKWPPFDQKLINLADLSSRSQKFLGGGKSENKLDPAAINGSNFFIVQSQISELFGVLLREGPRSGLRLKTRRLRETFFKRIRAVCSDNSKSPLTSCVLVQTY